MSPNLLDLSAVALAGIALTGAILSFSAPTAHMAPAGEPGVGIEMALGSESPMRTADTRSGRVDGNLADPLRDNVQRTY